MRYFINLSYDGTNYHGWQVQKNAQSVQGTINEAMTTILREPVEIFGSGRTDAGVHAVEQVAHFDFQEKIDLDNLVYKLNSLLPTDIAINHIRGVKPDISARFDAIKRQYVYQITQRKNPFKTKQAYYFRRSLDIDKMNDLKPLLLEWKDYESLSRVKTEVDHFLCDIFDMRWQIQNGEINFIVSANRFLRGMVRAMVGTMIEVGLGNINQSHFKEILESRDRKKAGPAVPAHGLFLLSVNYPEDIYL